MRYHSLAKVWSHLILQARIVDISTEGAKSFKCFLKNKAGISEVDVFYNSLSATFNRDALVESFRPK